MVAPQNYFFSISDVDAKASVHRPCSSDNVLFPVVSSTASVSSEPVTSVDTSSFTVPIDCYCERLGFTGSNMSRVTFEVDTGATHSMLGSLELCRTILADFDARRILMIDAPGGQTIYAQGCGRLVEGGILTEEVWCVPAIGERGLLSTPQAIRRGVSCTLNRDGVEFSKGGITLLKGRLDRNARNFKVDITLNICCKGLHSSIISSIPYPDLEYVCPVSLSSIDSCTDDETDSEDGNKESFKTIDSLVPCLQGSNSSSIFSVMAPVRVADPTKGYL